MSFDLSVTMSQIVNTTAFTDNVEQRCEWAIETFGPAYIIPELVCSLETFEAIEDGNVGKVDAASTGVEVYVDLFANNGNQSYVAAATNALISAANSNSLYIVVGGQTIYTNGITLQPNSPPSTPSSSTSSSSAWALWSTNVIIVIAAGGAGLVLIAALSAYFCYRYNQRKTFEVRRADIQMHGYNTKFDTDLIQANPLQQYVATTTPKSTSPAINNIQSWHARV